MRIALGTTVIIEAQAPSEHAANAALAAAFAAITAVERRLHPARAGSDLSRIACAAPHSSVGVAVGTWTLLALAQRIHALSAGVFDPCLPCAPGRLSDLELLPPGLSGSGRYGVVPHAPLALDLGGIAKGYAVDCAIEALRTHDCRAGLVNAGGDMRVFGAEPREILVRQAGGRFAPLALQDSALAVTDPLAAARPPEHRGYYTRNGSSSLRRCFAAVRAKRAAVADALTKCVLFCPEECADRVLARMGATVLACA